MAGRIKHPATGRLGDASVGFPCPPETGPSPAGRRNQVPSMERLSIRSRLDLDDKAEASSGIEVRRLAYGYGP